MKLPHCVRRSLLFALLALAAAAVTPDVVAEDKEHDTIREAVRRGEVLPLSRILAIAQQRVPGEVLEIELDDENKGAKLIYEIKILAATGRVREIEIDARTGTVLEIEDE